MMAEQDDIRAMATRFFDAIEQGDIETMLGSFTPDAEIWHNTDELIVTPAQTAQTLSDNVAKANDQYNIQGTPTILINGKVEENLGTWPALRSRLKELGA